MTRLGAASTPCAARDAPPSVSPSSASATPDGLGFLGTFYAMYSDELIGGQNRMLWCYDTTHRRTHSAAELRGDTPLAGLAHDAVRFMDMSNGANRASPARHAGKRSSFRLTALVLQLLCEGGRGVVQASGEADPDRGCAWRLQVALRRRQVGDTRRGIGRHGPSVGRAGDDLAA
jgi:hypothetical protein